MKVQSGLDAAVPPAPRRSIERTRRFLTAAFATGVVLLGLEWTSPGLIFARLSRQADSAAGFKHAANSFEWSNITPQSYLDFHPCYDGFECAKLSLPLDYFNEQHPNHTVSVAIAKLPAKVPINDPRYGGPILLNPGGPGGSGASFALQVAKSLQIVVDSDIDPRIISSSAKYFDLIGFDPRGIGETEPAAACFSDGPLEWSWALRENTEGIVGSSDAALGRLWSMSHAFGASCKQALDAQDGPDIKQYMTTAFVARDMLEIVERHAQYVLDKAAQLPKQTHPGRRPRCRGPRPSEAKLQYWGVSYGTYLGSTFASMFPDRVGRLILDGVVSSYDYNNALGNGSLSDTEKAMSSFYTFCLHSGPEDCPLATSNSTISDIELRVQTIVQSLYHMSLAINSPQGPEVLTYSDMKAIIFSAVYQPQLAFPLLASLLAAIEAGQGDILANLGSAIRNTHIYSCPTNTSHPTKAYSSIATTAILCTDGIDQSQTSLSEFTSYFHLLESMSPTSGAIWSVLKMRCASWLIRARYRFPGPFGSSQTNHPILFISNTADPVTPLRSGRVMHALFPGSALLLQDTAGHCAMFAPTACTLKYVRGYFQTGDLPAEGIVCVPPPSAFSLNSTDPKSPFYDPELGGASTDALVEGVETQKLLNLAVHVRRAFAESETFGLLRTVVSERTRGLLRVKSSGKTCFE